MLPEFCGHLLVVFGTPFEVADSECTGLRSHFPTRHERNLIRGDSCPSRFLSVLLNTENLHYHHQTFLTMLFYKSLVSFVTAIALASSVTASATPERRQSCHTGSLVCCASTNSFSSVDPVLQDDLLVFDPNLDTSLLVGLVCVLDVAGWYCTP